jgi:single-strand DNA-binding protein
MPSFNRIHLIGRLGKDPEIRQTNSGKNLSAFSLAVDRRWKGADGETNEATDWFNVEAWGSTAEICQRYLAKGCLVFLEGRVQIDRYERNGQTLYYTKVVATRVQNLERKPEEPEPLEG